MSVSYKAKALSDQLKSDLALRLPVQAALGLAQSFDSNGNPVIIIGANTTTTMSALIRIKGVAGFGKDVLGTAQNVFTPHLIELCMEMSTITDVSYWTWDLLVKLVGEVYKPGIQVDVYLTANTVMPTASAPGTFKGSFTPHIQYGQMASI